MKMTSAFPKKNTSTIIFWFLFLLEVINCETTGNIHQNGNSLHGHPPNLQDDSSSSSSSKDGPTRIGLSVDGRMKCLLWRNPKAVANHQGLTPLFSSPAEEEEDTIDLQSDTIRSIPTKNSKLLSLFTPGAIFATTNYRFRKDRWYGVEKIGMIFRWNAPSSVPQDNTNLQEEDGDSSSPSKKRRFFAPTTVDITVGRSIFSPTKSNHPSAFTSFVDSGNLRVGWQQQGEQAVGMAEANTDPWIEVGFDSCDAANIGGFLEMRRRNRKGQPFHLGFFLPLVRRRFDLQWTSRWDGEANDSSMGYGMENDDMIGNQWSSKHRRPGDDPWWMPTISLDPSLGTLSAENKYRDAFAGRNDRNYWTEFKLRVRTTMPTLLNNAVGASDDDDDLQTAAIRLDCSLVTDPRSNNHQSLGPTVSTARFETIVVPSFWWSSILETARFGLIHEQHHLKKN